VDAGMSNKVGGAEMVIYHDCCDTLAQENSYVKLSDCTLWIPANYHATVVPQWSCIHKKIANFSHVLKFQTPPSLNLILFQNPQNKWKINWIARSYRDVLCATCFRLV
jgi:hypothetical protein